MRINQKDGKLTILPVGQLVCLAPNVQAHVTSLEECNKGEGLCQCRALYSANSLIKNTH